MKKAKVLWSPSFSSGFPRMFQRKTTRLWFSFASSSTVVIVAHISVWMEGKWKEKKKREETFKEGKETERDLQYGRERGLSVRKLQGKSDGDWVDWGWHFMYTWKKMIGRRLDCIVIWISPL